MPKAITLTTGWLMQMFCAIALAQTAGPAGVSSTQATEHILGGMEKAQSDTRPDIPYWLTREYRLSAADSGKVASDVVAEISFVPPANKTYAIQKRTGSSRGEEVVRRVLDHEMQLTAHGHDPGAAAVNSQNYRFIYLGETASDGHICYLLRMNPLRKQKDLLSGVAWVDKQSFLIRRIEGEMAKLPSWWLKKVRVTIQFADVRGMWLQTRMEAVAEVRFFGNHILTSQLLEYRPGHLTATRAAAVHSRNNVVVK
jgi:hypothetical protein